MTTTNTRLVASAAVILALLTAACGDSTPPTAPAVWNYIPVITTSTGSDSTVVAGQLSGRKP